MDIIYYILCTVMAIFFVNMDIRVARKPFIELTLKILCKGISLFIAFYSGYQIGKLIGESL